MRKSSSLVVGFCAWLTSLDASTQIADEKKWFAGIDMQGVMGSYPGSSDRDSLSNLGMFLHLDRFERSGITVGYSRTTLNYQGNGEGIEQDNWFLSGRFGLTPDALDGRITLRLDSYDVSNRAASEAIESGTSTMIQLSYLNYGRTFYWDMGFARSDYDQTSGPLDRISLDQLTPTIGIGVNDRRDWIQLRAYLIDWQGDTDGAAFDGTSAIELKWTHWLPPQGMLGLENLKFGVLVGERVFAVDPDAANIYNLSDRQSGGWSAGGQWAIADNSHLLLVFGTESFEGRTSGEKYRSPFLYLNLSHRWN